MKEYIEREAVVEMIKENSTTRFDWSEAVDIEDLIPAIKDIPAADVAPVRHGKWIKTSYPEVHRCSVCNKPSNTSKGLHNYCPECGARMDGEASTTKNYPRCHKCVYEIVCSKDKDNDHTCPDYRRDAPDGGYYG